MDKIKSKNKEEIICNENELEHLTASPESDSFESENIYPMTDIKVERGFYTVFELKRKYDKKDKKIILDSSFQRGDVWGKKQKCELVESVLMGLPLPVFYFNQNKQGKLIVVDGRQRLTALFEFMDNSYPLTKLNILRSISGKRFEELTPIQQSMIEDYQIQAHVILPPTPDRIKFDIFDRVNRAGTKLNKQEIRNALYQGSATELLQRLASSEEFNMATGGALNKEKRMKDRYILLRFLAFQLLFSGELKDDEGKLFEYRNDIDELLAITMETLNSMEDIELTKLEKLTKDALGKSYFYLGRDAFRQFKADGKKSPINMNLFETIMYMMVYLPCEDEEILEKLQTKVDEMLCSDIYVDAIGNHRDNLKKIKTRFELAANIGKEFAK